MRAASVIQLAMRELELDVAHPRTVLVVDDERENLDVIEALLEDEYDVYVAERGAEALAKMEFLGGADVLIADQRMPEMTGAELLALVAVEYPDTVRMVLTGYSDVEPMLAAINRGDVYRFLLKPFDPTELRATIRDAMGLKWTTNALSAVMDGLVRQNRSLFDAQVRLTEEQDRLVAAERAAVVGRAASGLTHDIRNQITIVSLLTQVVENKSQDPLVLESARQLRVGSAGLLELLDCVHQLCRSEQPVVEHVNGQRFFEETLESFREQPAGRDRSVELSVAPEVGQLEINVPATRQALLGILRSAAERSGESGAIGVRARREGPGRLCVDVEGSGKYAALGTGGGVGMQIAQLAAETQEGRLLVGSGGEPNLMRLILDSATDKRTTEHA